MVTWEKHLSPRLKNATQALPGRLFVVFLAFFVGLTDQPRSAVGSKRDQPSTLGYETVSSAAVCCAESIDFPYVPDINPFTLTQRVGRGFD
jgi:hypothetical protein